MNFLFRKKVTATATPAPVIKASQEVPDYLGDIVAQVEEHWESVDPEQFDHALEAFNEANFIPLEMLETDLEKQGLELRNVLQRMIEVAPDFFDKALRRSGWESGYLLDGEARHE
ncbi:hypothetical protein [uncultured Cohaesibacter sp.]|uniref:hypothetical protein n=1 Tax=uncultured Cohaesibacter sp. TaxID=1002546 RepID=UPI002931B54E|nr:hypothetical protein [uncultured Cohaesibacter sp.]